MPSVKQRFDEALQSLCASGLRRTQARRAILGLLAEATAALSTEDIHRSLAENGCDLVTVYRNLNAMEKIGLLRRRFFPDRVLRYELKNGPSFLHSIRCRQCSQSERVDFGIPETLLEDLKCRGYRSIESRFDFEGICQRCAEASVLMSRVDIDSP